VTHARILASVKSLFTFATRLGYLQGNPGIATRLPSVPADLAERILPEEAIHRLIHATQNPRDHALLRLMYSTGARVGEIARLEWRHFQASQDNGAFVTLYGKGAKTRTVRVSSATWQEVGALRGDADPDAAVFRSRNKGARLGAAQIGNIVKDAAERAGLGGKVSPHWLRHAHASHSLDRGANVKVVQETLGHSSLAITSRYLHARPEDSSGLYLAV
jgi:integrase/recombinase XerD